MIITISPCDLIHLLVGMVFFYPGLESGKLEKSNVPMMITLTFSGAVNGENINVYNKLFKP